MRFYPTVSTGKERDEETGYGYFGARYMDHDLMTMWLSVDPMADKYPGISPYAYCAWNPIKLVDPDGDDLWIINGDEIIKYTAGMSNEGLEGFSRMVVNTLNKIYGEGGDEGAELVGALCASKNVFNIRQRDGIESEFIASNPYAAYARNNEAIVANWDVAVKYGWDSGSGGDVLWNTKGYPYITEDGVRDNPIYQLIHELGHAYDANLGIMDNRIYKGFPDDKGASLNEWSACARANCIGPYMGYPLQTVYGGSIDSFGKLIPGTGTRLYDSEGNPINPF